MEEQRRANVHLAGLEREHGVTKEAEAKLEQRRAELDEELEQAQQQLVLRCAEQQPCRGVRNGSRRLSRVDGR